MTTDVTCNTNIIQTDKLILVLVNGHGKINVLISMNPGHGTWLSRAK
jgi:hypothetical protein